MAWGGRWEPWITKISYDASRDTFYLLYFRASYPRSRYGAGQVLIPEEPNALKPGTEARNLDRISQCQALEIYQSGVEALNAQTQIKIMQLLGQKEIIPPFPIPVASMGRD